MKITTREKIKLKFSRELGKVMRELIHIVLTENLVQYSTKNRKVDTYNLIEITDEMLKEIELVILTQQNILKKTELKRLEEEWGQVLGAGYSYN